MAPKDKIIITTGEFDPLTYDELRYLQKCRSKGSWLIVGIHSDWYMQYARGGFMQNNFERNQIVRNLKCVDEVFEFNDQDGTICHLLKIVKFCYPNADMTYISPEDMNNMPETSIKGIKFETMR